MTLMAADAETTQSPDTTSGVFPIAHEHPYTVDDLEGMPDDGRRYELIDGVLCVSPAPAFRHQRLSLRLGGVLDAACARDLVVLRR